jgi:hypothetical protein
VRVSAVKDIQLIRNLASANYELNRTEINKITHTLGREVELTIATFKVGEVSPLFDLETEVQD